MRRPAEITTGGLGFCYGPPVPNDFRDFNLRVNEMTKSKRPLIQLAAALFACLGLALFASAPGRAEIHCAGGHCNCSGDKDCNTMFEHLCTDTGGSCNNDNNTCTCTQKAKVLSGGTGTKKNPVGAATGQKLNRQ